MYFDVTIKHPFSMLVVGCSGSGKTVLVQKLLEHRHEMIEGAPNSIKWYYGAWQESFRNLNYTFIEGCPETPDEDSDCIMVIDDLMCEAQEQVSKIFTKFRHHSKVSCIFLCQNLFPRGPHSRTISLNSNYIVLMKNSRDKAQIHHLAVQMFPGRSKVLVNVFEDATRQPFSYLMLDFQQTTPDNLRMRTRIFPGEQMVVYQPRV